MQVDVQEGFGYTTSYYLISGGLAGMIEHAAMFPIDTLKTRLQANRAGQEFSLRHTWRAAISHGGAPALYRGVIPGMCGAFPSHAAYFAVYENVKIFLGEDQESLLHYALAGACATIGHDLFHTPFDVIKQRLQVSDVSAGAMHTLRRVLRNEGFGAIFASVPTTIAMNIPFAAVHFTTYETIKKMLGVSEEELENSFWKYTIAGGLGGALGGFVSNPFDVIKTRQQLGIASRNVFRAFWDSYLVEGPKLFTRGVRARVLYFTPSAAISMTSYEMAKWVLSATRFAGLFRSDKPRANPRTPCPCH
jgi:solute carrier family 25 iron transporter 28/37